MNEVGHESGFSALPTSHTLPWQQDTSEVNAWSTWSVTYRNVVMLGPDHARIGVYNLTEHDLGNPANYASLRDFLKAKAAGP